MHYKYKKIFSLITIIFVLFIGTNNAYAIKEETIAPAYDELYKLNAGQDPKDVANNLRRILRL